MIRETEAQFQSAVIDMATMNGWEHYHPRNSQRSRAGWPDLALWHPRRRIFMLRELKALDGKASPEQIATIASLFAAGVDCRIWAPSDWLEVQRTLGR